MTTNPEKENAGRGPCTQEDVAFDVGNKWNEVQLKQDFCGIKNGNLLYIAFKVAIKLSGRFWPTRPEQFAGSQSSKPPFISFIWRPIQNKNPPPSSKRPGLGGLFLFFILFIYFLGYASLDGRCRSCEGPFLYNTRFIVSSVPLVVILLPLIC